MSNGIQGVYLVTDRLIQEQFTHYELAEQAIKGGVNVIQFRDKKMGGQAAVEQIRRIAELCRREDVPFIVNDRVDLALAGGADGVHLGQDDLPVGIARGLMGSDKIVGGTASTVEEAVDVERKGADYVGFGHIFKTDTKKKGYEPRGVDMLHEVCSRVSIPVIAIGGINKDNAGRVMESGAEGFAVTSAICAADDPKRSTEELAGIYENYSSHEGG